MPAFGCTAWVVSPWPAARAAAALESCLLEKLANIRSQCFGVQAVPGIEPDTTARIEDIGDRRVLHRIGSWRLALYFLVVDLEFLRHLGKLLLVRHQRQVLRVEVAHVGAKHFGRIPLWIDGDEDHLEFVSVASEELLDARHLAQGRRTHVGALGEAEEHRDDVAPKVVQFPGSPGMIDERKIARIGSTGDIDALELTAWPGQPEREPSGSERSAPRDQQRAAWNR